MADADGGLRDALKAAGDAANLLAKDFPGTSKEISELAAEMRSGRISAEYWREEITRLIDKTKILGDESGRLKAANDKLILSIVQTDNSIKAADFAKFSSSVTQVTGAIVSAIDGISAVARSTTGGELINSIGGATSQISDFMMKIGAASSLIAPEFGIPLLLAGSGLKVFGAAAGAAISVVDTQAKAQANMVSALLQSGVAVSGHAAQISNAAEQSAMFGAKLGLTEDQAGGVAVKLAEMGAHLNGTNLEFGNLETSSEGYGKAIESVASLSRGLGVDLGAATGVVGVFTARAGLSGDQITESTGKLVYAQHKSGVEAGAFIKNFSALAESSKQYGTNVDSLISRTAVFSDALVKGTLSISNVIAMTDVQSQSQENQAALAQHIMQTDSALAEKMGLVQGDAMGNIIRLGMHSDLASGAIVKWAREIGSSQASPEAGAAVMNTFLKLFNAYIPDATTALGVYTGKMSDVNKILDGMKGSAPASEFDKLKKSAASVLEGLSPASDRLNAAATHLSHSAAATVRASELFEKMMSGSSDPFAGLTGGKYKKPALSRPGTDMSLADSFSAAAVAYPGYATGGLIPDEGLYHLHAGERVVSSGGSGGGVNISLGGMNISVGDTGDMRSQIHNALMQVESQVMRKIEDQFSQAQHAQ